MVARSGYVPERGDIVWLQFAPQAGHEQAGRRPALVVSPRSYNGKVGSALFCPLTSQVKGYPFEVTLAPGGKATGAILSDQLKSLIGERGKPRSSIRCPPPCSQRYWRRLLPL